MNNTQKFKQELEALLRKHKVRLHIVQSTDWSTYSGYHNVGDPELNVISNDNKDECEIIYTTFEKW